MKRMLLFVGVLCLVLGFTTVAYAEDNEKARSLILAQDFNKIPREALLGIYAYGTSEPGNEQEYNNLKEKYLEMNDADFNKAIINHFKKVADKKDKGEDIIWNKDIVDLISILDSELGNRIKMQINQTIARDTIEKDTKQENLRYTPGNNRKIWTYYGHGLGGMRIFSFTCDIYWAWDSTQITTVSPSTREKHCIQDGLRRNHSNQAYFLSPTSYWYVEGRFVQYIAGQPCMGYPYHDIVIQGGGAAS